MSPSTLRIGCIATLLALSGVSGHALAQDKTPAPAPAPSSSAPLAPLMTAVTDSNADLAELSAAALASEIEELRKRIAVSDERLEELREAKELRTASPLELRPVFSELEAIPNDACKTGGGPSGVEEAAQRTVDRLQDLTDSVDSGAELRPGLRSTSLKQLAEQVIAARSAKDTPDEQACTKLRAALKEVPARARGYVEQTHARIKSLDDALDRTIEKEEQKRATLAARLRTALGTAKSTVDSDAIIDKLPVLVIILGVFSLAIMVMVRRFKDPIQKNWVESGQVIQFMTVLILVNVILVLGLAGILEGETLGTLLGGIAGYMLSQGVARAATRSRTNDETTEGA